VAAKLLRGHAWLVHQILKEFWEMIAEKLSTHVSVLLVRYFVACTEHGLSDIVQDCGMSEQIGGYEL